MSRIRFQIPCHKKKPFHQGWWFLAYTACTHLIIGVSKFAIKVRYDNLEYFIDLLKIRKNWPESNCRYWCSTELLKESTWSECWLFSKVQFRSSTIQKKIFLELALCEIELFLKKWFVYSYQICPYSQTIIWILNASYQKNVSKWPELCHWWSIWNGFWSRFVEPYILTYIIERIFVCIFVQPRIEIEYHWELQSHHWPCRKLVPYEIPDSQYMANLMRRHCK